AVVEYVDRVLTQALFDCESIDDPGDLLEGVIEMGGRIDRGLSEAGKIRSNHAVALCQHRNQVTEHVRRRAEAVEQQDDGSVRWTGLAIEDAHRFDIGRTVVDLCVVCDGCRRNGRTQRGRCNKLVFDAHDGCSRVWKDRGYIDQSSHPPSRLRMRRAMYLPR